MAHWVFGYGSLVWRPAFEFIDRAPACVRGWRRRFHQGSTDHRGTPEAPGRVVTLEPEPGTSCWGMAYRVDAGAWTGVRAQLDERERGGYGRHRVELRFSDAGRATAHGEIYIAEADNENYLGPAPLEAIARQVCASEGPSGHNVEYVLKLDEALTAMGADDSHVAELARLVRGHEATRGRVKS